MQIIGQFYIKVKVTNMTVNPNLVPKVTLSDGTQVPAVGLGTFASDNYTSEVVADAVAGALRSGYRFLDCASVYGNEADIGRVLADAFAEGIVTRDELFITSKVWNDMHGKGDVLLSCAKTLKDLQLDQLDIYFVHWPFPNYHAPGCDGDARNPDSKPFDVDRFMATWRQMERLVDMGLTKRIGMSNMTIPKLEKVLPLVRIMPSMIEMEIHPSFQQQELYDYCMKRGIQVIGFCPLGSPKRPERDRTAEDVNDLEMPEVVAIANAHNIHPALVCLKWAVQRGEVVIPFSVREKNYVANLACVTEDPLTDEEMQSMATLERNCRLVKGQVFLWPGATRWEDLWDLDGNIAQ